MFKDRKSIGSILIVLLMIISMFSGMMTFLPMVEASPGNVYVSPDQDAGWYDATHVKTIQEGIDNATAGDTIYVWDGTYDENVDIGKTLSLIGNGTAVTIVDGDGLTGNLIDITANNVTISEFTIKNIQYYNGVNIDSANNCTIQDNIITDNRNGIQFSSSNNINIANNTIQNHEHRGVRSLNSNNSVISNNTISNNTLAGIELYSANLCNVSGNEIEGGTRGVYILSSSTDNGIFGNTIENVTLYYGIYICESSNNNSIYNNSFKNNANNAYDSESNTWNISKTLGTNIIGGAYLGGNYWDDYTGADWDGDGLGDADLPYNCSGNIASGGDYHPLVVNATPSVSSPYPSNESTDISVPPSWFNITISDPEDDTMNITWQTNESGGWVTFNTSIDKTNGTYSVTNTSWVDSYNTKYWWRVLVNDSDGNWKNQTYEFTTVSNATVYVDDDAPSGWYDGVHVHTVQEGVDNVSAGGTVYVWDGTYDENVVVNKTVTLVGNGTAVTIVDGGGVGDVIYITVDWVNMSGFNITNGGDNGIEFDDYTNNITIESCIIYGNGDNGIKMDLAGNDNSICNCTIHGNGNDGIWGEEGDFDYIYIFNNGIHNNSGNGIWINGMDYSTIANNTIENNGVGQAGNQYGIYIEGIEHTDIENNTITGNDNGGIYFAWTNDDVGLYNNNISNNGDDGIYIVGYFDNVIMDGNDISNNNDDGIEFYTAVDYTNITIRNGTISGNDDYGIYFDADTQMENVTVDNVTVINNYDGIASGIAMFNLTISNCNISYNEDNGICLYAGDNVTIKGNTVDFNEAEGMGIGESDNNSIHNNSFSNNAYYGVAISECSNNTIADNDILNNGYNGIDFCSPCSNNTISNNNISNNGESGIYLNYATTGYPSITDNNFTNNTILNNTDYGIYFYYATGYPHSNSGNFIYNNYFDNTNNSYDKGNNTWNTTKTSGTNIIGGDYLGGNYWDDYTGNDTDSDGLGDTLLPYNCSGNIIYGGDYHPLTPCNPVYVDDDADPGWYDACHVHTVQEGVDNVSTGGTIYVWDGTYNENVEVYKTVSLIGNGTVNSIIDAGGIGDVVRITVDWVNVSGFNITNGGDKGIKFDTNNVTIEDCIICSNVNYGIDMDLGGNDNNICNCTVHGNGDDGICGEAGDLRNIYIFNNSIYDNGDEGICFDGISHSNISSNNISGNAYGIYLDGSDYNTINGNIIDSNGDGIDLWSSSNNSIYNNYVSSNTDFNARTDAGCSDNTWNITKTAGTNIIDGNYLGGNYWSDYTGYDTDGDGLGDTDLPYNSSGNIQNGGDYHPLTSSNSKPVFSNENPSNESIDVPISTSIWNITIEDPDGNTFNWSIETSPNVGSNSSNDDTNGSKNCSLSGLQYETNYTVYVNATDGNASTNETFWFRTELELVASFTYSPSVNLTISDIIQFTDTSTGSPTSWNWSFGDGTWNDSQNPTHQYPLPAIETVTLTISRAGESNTTSEILHIGRNVSLVIPTGYHTGYNWFAWSNHTITNASTVSTWLADLGVHESIYIYNSSDRSWLGYTIGIGGTDFTINPYDVVCVLVANEKTFRIPP